MKTLILSASNHMDRVSLSKYYPIPDSLVYPMEVESSAKVIRDCLTLYLKSISSLGITHILVLNIKVFKILTGEKKASHAYGQLFDCVHPGYEGIKVLVAPGYQTLFRNPNNKRLIDLSLDTLKNGQRQYRKINERVIYRLSELREALQELHQYQTLAVDIEGFSLRYTEAKIATIAFAWSPVDGMAFERTIEGVDIGYHLAEFFSEYRGKLVCHNSPYDVSVMIYELFMQHKLDYRNMLDALDLFYRDMEDTKLMVYLVENSTADISLKLKDSILEEYGDYGLDVTDITKIPMPDLLKYNQTDACGTYWLYEQYMPKVCAWQQDELYREKFLPAQKVLTYMEMVGMPMLAERVQEARNNLETIIQSQLSIISSSQYAKEVELLLKKEKIEKDNKVLKKLVRTMDNVKHIPFNPGSNKHLAKLFHDVLKLPVESTTPTGQPATDEDAVNNHLHAIDSTEIDKIHLLQAILELGKAAKILNTFIAAFEKAETREDNRVYLTGNFNLGGTQSLRISSSDPNLTNLPSGSTYGPLIKKCFYPPKDKLIASCDYSALEAMVNALLTKDPNLLKIYTDHYDSHSLNTFAYWPDHMPDIKAKVEAAEMATEFWVENGEYYCA